MPKRPFEHAQIAPHDDAVRFDAVLRFAQEICRQERRYQPRHQQREGDRNGDRETELPEILPRDAAHEGDRREHRDDGHGGRDHREPNLVRRLQRGAIGRFAHPHVPDDVLDLDNGIIDQDAGDQRDRQQADGVQRKPEQVHRPEGRNNRQRYRQHGNRRGSKVAQKDQHHDDREDSAFGQGLHGGAIIGFGIAHRAVDLGHRQLAMLPGERLQLVADRFGDRHIGEAFCAVNAKGDDRLAIEAGEAAGFRGAIADRGNLLQPGLSTARQHDGAIGQLLDRGGAGEHADGLLLRAHLAAAAGEIDIAGAQLLVHVERSDAERDQPVGQQRDPDFTVDAAGALDLGDAANALQRRRT